MFLRAVIEHPAPGTRDFEDPLNLPVASEMTIMVCAHKVLKTLTLLIFQKLEI